MHNIIELRPKPKREDVDCFGGCPRCWRNDGYLNVGYEPWYICHRHRVKWLVGEDLFSGWRYETNLEWQANAARICGYRVVDPIYPRPRRPRRSPESKRATYGKSSWRRRGSPKTR
jgi:hypothetical protein